MTAATGYAFPYVGPDHKLHCPHDRQILSVDGRGMWLCATNDHLWHRFGSWGAWKLMRGKATS